MRLRARFFLHLLALHLGVGGVCGALLWQEHRPWIFLLEGLLGLSLWLFYRRVKALTLPLEIIADGSRFLGEGDFSHTFVPSASEEVNRLVELYNALVTRLRAERHRQQEQHFFLEKVLEVSPAGIVTFTPDGVPRYANPAARRMLGQVRDPITPATGEVPGLALPAPLATVWSGMDEGTSRVVALAGQRRVRASRSATLEEGFSCAVLILEELTGELISSERNAYEKLIRTLSHEINNSLGASQSLLRSCLDWAPHLPAAERPDFVQALTVVLERGRHLGQFMNSYADVVRLPAPVRRPCDVSALLRDLLALQEAEFRQRGIRLDMDQHPGSWPAHLDRPQFEQVLLNVLRNCCDALSGLPRGTGRIRVGTRMEDLRLCVEIADNGPGLSPEALENLFTPFFTTRPGGQGIGLTLVRDILTHHKLDFTLENAPDGGAVFRVWVGQTQHAAPGVAG